MTETIARPVDIPAGHLHQSELIRRGWTRELIAELLGDARVRTSHLIAAHLSPWWFPPAAVEAAESGAAFQEHRAQVQADDDAAARKAATDAKRTATLAAKKAAAADLDRAIARDAGYPEQSSWLASVKPGLLKKAADTPIWVFGPSGAYAVLTPAGCAVGDVLTVALKDRRDGTGGGTVTKEITGITRIGARGGQLWILAAVEDPDKMDQRRAKAAAEAGARERETAARAAREAVAKAEAEVKAVAAREAAEAKRELARQASAAEEARIAALTDDEVDVELTRLIQAHVAHLLADLAPAELVTALQEQGVERVMEQSKTVTARRQVATRMVTAQAGGYGVDDPTGGAATDVRAVLRMIKTGRLDRTINDLRSRVDARFVRLDGDDWAILADASRVKGTITVDKARGESLIKPTHVYQLGEHGGVELALIWLWAEA